MAAGAFVIHILPKDRTVIQIGGYPSASFIVGELLWAYTKK